MQPTVFISYSWDSTTESNEVWVEQLAIRLADDGVNVRLDKWDVKPGDFIAHFMGSAIAESDKVLMICTPRYKESMDKGNGAVGYEGNIITAQIWLTADHRKFIPILKQGNLKSAIPAALQGKCYLDMTSEPMFELQYRQLVPILKGVSDVGVNKPVFDREQQTALMPIDYDNLSFTILEQLNQLAIGQYVSHYRAKIIQFPRNAVPFFSIGLCALHMGLLQMARDKFKRAIDLDATAADYYYYYALSLCAGKSVSEIGLTDAETAIRCIEMAIDLDKYQSKYYAFLLMLYSFETVKSAAYNADVLIHHYSHGYKDENEMRRLITFTSSSNMVSNNLIHKLFHHF